MLAKDIEGNNLECALMRGCEDHVRRHPVAMGTQPIGGGHTPPIARYETGEPVLSHWSAQIVADGQLMLEELGGDHRTNSVTPTVFESGRATSVTEETRDGVGSTRLQLPAYDVSIDHVPSIAHGLDLGELQTDAVDLATSDDPRAREMKTVRVGKGKMSVFGQTGGDSASPSVMLLDRILGHMNRLSTEVGL